MRRGSLCLKTFFYRTGHGQKVMGKGMGDCGMTVGEAFGISDILRDASPSSRAEIMSFACIKRYEKGQHVFYDSEELSCFYIILEGLASLYKLNTLGEKKVVFIYGPGKMLNEIMFQDLPVSINCEIRESAQVLVLSKERFWHVMERDPGLTRAAFDAMALRVRRLYRQMKNTTNAMKGEKRLAAKLYKLARDYGVTTDNGVLIQMQLSITYLSEMLGSQRETVSRQAKKLGDLGLIYVEKNHFWVPDLEKLSDYFKQP